MALAATFAGLGFGNAGVHIPHANAYPIAGRVRDFHPDGYPGDEPMVPHGMAVSLTAPEAFRFDLRGRPGAAPARPPSCSRPDADALATTARRAAGVLDRPDARHRHPQRPRRGRLRRGATSTTSSRAPLKQQRLLATARARSAADDLAGIMTRSLELWE